MTYDTAKNLVPSLNRLCRLKGLRVSYTPYDVAHMDLRRLNDKLDELHAIETNGTAKQQAKRNLFLNALNA